MYPIAIVLIISLFKNTFYKFGFLSLGGFFVSLYHIYLQNGGGGGGSIHISPNNGYSDYNITGEGGNGGNGIAIIKFKNRYNNNVLVRNAYLYYNYDKK